MEELKKLIDLKSIITIILAIAFVVGYFIGLMSPENFFAVVLMVFTFYFSKDKNKTK